MRRTGASQHVKRHWSYRTAGHWSLRLHPAARLDVAIRQGGEETTRSGRLVRTMTAEVVDVLPGGDLVVRGSREVSVNHEKEIMVVEGTIRPQDIGPDNTIPRPW